MTSGRIMVNLACRYTIAGEWCRGMDQILIMQLATVSRILSNLLEPSSDDFQDRPWRQKKNALAAAKAIRANLVDREQQVAFLPSCNPGWRILVELYIAQGEGKPLSISDAGHVSGIPIATALRWLTLLQEHDMLERLPDVRDRRRYWLSLSPKGQSIVEIAVLNLFENMASVAAVNT